MRQPVLIPRGAGREVVERIEIAVDIAVHVRAVRVAGVPPGDQAVFPIFQQPLAQPVLVHGEERGVVHCGDDELLVLVVVARVARLQRRAVDGKRAPRAGVAEHHADRLLRRFVGPRERVRDCVEQLLQNARACVKRHTVVDRFPGALERDDARRQRHERAPNVDVDGTRQPLAPREQVIDPKRARPVFLHFPAGRRLVHPCRVERRIDSGGEWERM